MSLFKKNKKAEAPVDAPKAAEDKKWLTLEETAGILALDVRDVAVLSACGVLFARPCSGGPKYPAFEVMALRDGGLGDFAVNMERMRAAREMAAAWRTKNEAMQEECRQRLAETEAKEKEIERRRERAAAFVEERGGVDIWLHFAQGFGTVFAALRAADLVPEEKYGEEIEVIDRLFRVMSVREISEDMNIPVDSVKKVLNRILGALNGNAALLSAKKITQVVQENDILRNANEKLRRQLEEHGILLDGGNDN